MQNVAGVANLTDDERLLVVRYRLCNDDRRDVLMHISRELVKQTNTEHPQRPSNVVLLTGRKITP